MGGAHCGPGNPVTPLSVFSPEALLPVALVVPVLLACLWPVPARRELLVTLAPWAAAPALALSILFLRPGFEPEPLEFPALATGLRLAPDPLGAAFLFLASALWFLAGIFARSYHADDPHRARFFGFFALTMAGNLGLTVAADALSFYLCFAVMTFSAYGLVVHRRTGAALRAGRVYIVMALLGEILLLAGLLMLGAAAGGLGTPGMGFGAELGVAWSELGERAPLVAGLVVAGFGVKAGLAPLHLWLPLAHPVAPTAASALLSGVMIKAGLLGWLRLLPGDLSIPGVGGTLLVVGVVTALYGVVVGVAQDDPKTVLAYSSVSQMGNMAIGASILLLAPAAAPIALAAVVLHALHHGVAKGALFLAVGVGDRVPGVRIAGPGDRGRGPGASRSKHRLRTLVLMGTALPALALVGAPLTSGLLSKALLKDALAAAGGRWYAVLDPLLLLAAAGTTLLMARFGVTWLRRMEDGGAGGGPGSHPGDREPPRDTRHWGLLLPWGALVLLGAGAPLWLPWAWPLPEAAALPSVLRDPGGALLPLVVGVLAAWWVVRRPGVLGRLGGLRTPPGDLLVPLESALRRPSALWKQPFPGIRSPAARWTTGTRERMARAMDAVSRRDLGLIRGPVLGLLLLGLSALLALVSLR
jgi:formate hydrogenlyase subunit 3/multisubunit Na+/H+ antiporter MnhD subunit